MLLLTLALLAPAAPCPAPSFPVYQSATRSPQTGGATKPFEPSLTALGLGTCTPIGASLCVPLDSSFTPAPMSSDPCGRNDDGSTTYFLDGWSFDFYGTAYGEVYVNNNGNVSFGAAFGSFSSTGFPIAGFPMIAPFWGDVDTRENDGTDGAVWYREWATSAGDSVNRLVVTWDNVGYYNRQTDKRNTFQVILTDGNDPLIGLGNNVCLCYDDMQWTTGSASSGTGGFGGVPATVGANRGDGVDFFQVGRFDAPGGAYDGPGGSNDGVDFLDDQTICFSVASGGSNVPPVFVNAVTRYSVDVGSTLMFRVEAIGPETAQTTTLTNDGGGLAGFSTVDATGNPATSDVTFTPAAAQLGTLVVEFTATDDGSPVGTSTLRVEILVEPSGRIGMRECDPAAPNSTGEAAQLWAIGQTTVAANDITLEMADLPMSAFGYLIVSRTNGVLVNPGGSTGTMCLNGSAIGRYDQSPIQASAMGTASQVIDLAMIPEPQLGSIAAMAGETWGWQLWYRDAQMGGSSNWTNSVRIDLQ